MVLQGIETEETMDHPNYPALIFLAALALFCLLVWGFGVYMLIVHSIDCRRGRKSPAQTPSPEEAKVNGEIALALAQTRMAEGTDNLGLTR